MKIIERNHFKFFSPFDFNEFSKLIDRNNYTTFLNGNWSPDYIFDNAVSIKNVQADPWFVPFYKYLNDSLNKKSINNQKPDIHLFANFSSGGKSVSHTDAHDVYIIGLYGRTLYRNEQQEIFVGPGDVLQIKGGEEHRAIGITPRIVASYSYYHTDKK